MKGYILVKSYLSIWFFYFIIVALLPASYSNGDYYMGVFWLFVLVILSTATFFILFSSYPQTRNRYLVYGINPPKYLNTMMWCSILFSMISVIFLTYDRITLQGVDYSKGVAFAREQWRVLGENRKGVSSIFSLFGNLLSGFPIILSSFLYLYYDEFKKTIRFLSLSISVLTVGISAFLSGGRSIIMMFLVSMFLIGLLRKFRGNGFVPRKISFIVLLFVIFIIIFSFIYAVYVFHLRAVAGGDSSLSYLVSTLNHLGGVYTGDTSSNEISLVDDIINYFVIVGAYLVHSVWTFQSILELNSYDGAVTFNFYRVLLARIFDTNAFVEWEFAGLFSTYSGAFYYDYGAVGAIISSFAVGFLIYISTLILYCRKLNPLHLGVFLSSMYIVLLSPLLFAVDIMSFPFILFDFFLLYLMSAFLRMRFFNLSRRGL